MTVRTPLKLDGTNLREMTTAERDSIRDYLGWYLGKNITAASTDFNTLSRVASSGNLGTISETRKKSGGAEVGTVAFAPETTTGEPQVVTTNFAHLSLTDAAANFAIPGDGSNIAWPAYQSGGNVYAMSTTDALDTFVLPAISDYVTAGDTAAVHYRVHTATSLSGYTAVSTSRIYADTRALTGTGGYADAVGTIGTQGTTQDFFTTITQYYLLKKDPGSAPSYTKPILVDSNGNLTEDQSAAGIGRLELLMKYAHANSTNYKVKFGFNTSGGTNLGNTMTDTSLDGSGDYRQRFVGVDDYRSQEFPNGTAQTIASHHLRIYRE